MYFVSDISRGSNSLTHYGIKGMKWGVRRTPEELGHISSRLSKQVISKPNEPTEMHLAPQSSMARVLGSIFPSIKQNQARFRNYNLKDKQDKIVGNMELNIDDDNTVNLVWLNVSSKREGKGYAQSAMRLMLDTVKKDGFSTVTLEVPTTSPNARHIYEKYGFKSTGEAMLGDENDVWGGLTKMRLDFKKGKK